MKDVKICFAASSGGHSTEIMRLKKLIDGYDHFFITEATPGKNESDKVYYLRQVNRRELKSLLYFVYLFFLSWRIISKEKPTHIISTGAMCTFPVCLIGKLRGIKIIYIESFARVNHASLTGKLLYKSADLFIVQWEDMLELYPKSVLGGGIF
jgi:UDP-N-acetylglucosamine:LPS N-acetylglucosamine transferase